MEIKRRKKRTEKGGKGESSFFPHLATKSTIFKKSCKHPLNPHDSWGEGAIVFCPLLKISLEEELYLKLLNFSELFVADAMPL